MADDINVNMIADQLAKKIDLPDNKGQDGIDYVVEWKAPTASDPTWYRVYKSGWVEQGGVVNNVDTTTNIYFTKKYATIPSVLVTELYNINTTNQTIINQIFVDRVIIHNDHTSKVASAVWEAKGQGA